MALLIPYKLKTKVTIDMVIQCRMGISFLSLTDNQDQISRITTIKEPTEKVASITISKTMEAPTTQATNFNTTTAAMIKAATQPVTR